MKTSVAQSNPPSPEEIAVAANILSRLTPGFLPKDIFLETTRLCATPILELVPLRRSAEGAAEVLLFQRPNDDPNWPGQLHTPGTVIRATDAGQGFDIPLRRLYSDELGFTPERHPKTAMQILHAVARGTEMSTIMYIDLTGVSTPAGVWHSAHALPGNLVDTQRDFITYTVNLFEGEQS